MQREQNNNNQPMTFCPNCRRYVSTQNFLLHQGRCEKQTSRLRSSRISQKSQKKQQQHFDKNNQINPKSSNYSIKNLPKQRIFPKMKKKDNSQNINQVQQRIPCFYCGYQQSLAQLDDHPKKCQHWELQCHLCKSKFPKSLMKDHQQVCQRNPLNIQRSQRNYQRSRMRRNDREEQQQFYDNQGDQQNFLPLFAQRRNRNLYQPSPLMNLFQSILAPSLNQRIRSIDRSPTSFFSFFSSINGEPQINFRSNSSNPQVFIQLIEMLANRANPNQNPGLRPQQLRHLKKIKYQKKSQQPDLCTICYCQFQQNQQIIQLNCKHIFHQQCIFEWLKRVSTCPVCKKSMRQQENNQHPNDGRSRRNQFQQQINYQQPNF